MQESLETYLGIKTKPTKDKKVDISNFGTFTDSKSAPIHRWFQYPAGFSYKAVEFALKKYRIKKGGIVYDPFVGTGTTSVVCKGRGIESYGVEAHSFVAKIAKTKVKWDYDYKELNSIKRKFIIELFKAKNEYKTKSPHSVPELVRKCYSDHNLQKLLFIRDSIEETIPDEYKDIFNMALISTLRAASGAATGWPYIAPKKKIEEKDGIKTFDEKLTICINDLRMSPEKYRSTPSVIREGDCRKTEFEDETFDFVFTSPPYLNNYDYADRTRLETYFMGIFNSWRDITDNVRKKLIISATTQIVRSEYDVDNIISEELRDIDDKLAEIIQSKVTELAKVRLTKGGKKSYDIMVGQYFNDMTNTLVDLFRLMKNNSELLMILGDSAPYGVYVPTDDFLGKIGLGIGFSNYKKLELRKRGSKWKGNPQRHHVPLRESIVIIRK